MKDEVKKAVHESIGHWVEIKVALESKSEKRPSHGSENCALCCLYNLDSGSDMEQCKEAKCLLDLAGQNCHRGGSVWKNYHNNESPAQAQNMIDALVSLLEEKPEKFHKLGERYLYGSSEYVLAKAGNYPNTIIMVNIASGGIWVDPVEVNDFNKITDKEFQAASSRSFQLVEKGENK